MRRHLMVAAVIGCAVALAVLLVARQRKPLAPKKEGEGTTAQKSEADTYGKGFQMRVDTGGYTQALTYYRDVVTRDTGFQTHPPPTLDDLLRYFGFSDLTGEQLEKEEPDAIMNRFPGGEVLVARFFAPKITDVTGLVSPPNYGWRKVVRLKASRTAAAWRAGLESMYLLFNVFNGNLNVSPFKTADGGVNHSVNNQVILRSGGFGGPALPQPLYFMTFGAFNANDPRERGKLITYLDATFDAGDPALASHGGLNRYYVPVACAVCHGRQFQSDRRLKLNYLDTDHWFDRIQKGDDFELVGKKQPVLFDAGTNDTTKPEFLKAFRIFSTLNKEIWEQNKRADGGGQSFQQVAAGSWLDGHESTVGHLSLFQRGIAREAGDAKWSEADSVDKELLPLLNRYCFRCHSSVEYHVYDKTKVWNLRESMIDRIRANPNGLPQHFMPQDREIRDPDRAKLIDLLGRMGPG